MHYKCTLIVCENHKLWLQGPAKPSYLTCGDYSKGYYKISNDLPLISEVVLCHRLYLVLKTLEGKILIVNCSNPSGYVLDICCEPITKAAISDLSLYVQTITKKIMLIKLNIYKHNVKVQRCEVLENMKHLSSRGTFPLLVNKRCYIFEGSRPIGCTGKHIDRVIRNVIFSDGCMHFIAMEKKYHKYFFEKNSSIISYEITQLVRLDTIDAIEYEQDVYTIDSQGNLYRNKEQIHEGRKYARFVELPRCVPLVYDTNNKLWSIYNWTEHNLPVILSRGDIKLSTSVKCAD